MPSNATTSSKTTQKYINAYMNAVVKFLKNTNNALNQTMEIQLRKRITQNPIRKAELDKRLKYMRNFPHDVIIDSNTVNALWKELSFPSKLALPRDYTNRRNYINTLNKFMDDMKLKKPTNINKVTSSILTTKHSMRNVLSRRRRFMDQVKLRGKTHFSNEEIRDLYKTPVNSAKSTNSFDAWAKPSARINTLLKYADALDNSPYKLPREKYNFLRPRSRDSKKTRDIEAAEIKKRMTFLRSNHNINTTRQFLFAPMNSKMENQLINNAELTGPIVHYLNMLKKTGGGTEAMESRILNQIQKLGMAPFNAQLRKHDQLKNRLNVLKLRKPTKAVLKKLYNPFDINKPIKLTKKQLLTGAKNVETLNKLLTSGKYLVTEKNIKKGMKLNKTRVHGKNTYVLHAHGTYLSKQFSSYYNSGFFKVPEGYTLIFTDKLGCISQGHTTSKQIINQSVGDVYPAGRWVPNMFLNFYHGNDLVKTRHNIIGNIQSRYGRSKYCYTTLS